MALLKPSTYAMTVLLSLFIKFWKQIAIGVLILGLAFFINRWDNQRLEAAYRAGANAVQEHYAAEKRRIAKEAELISQEISREAFGEMETVKQVLEKNYEQVNTVITIYEKEINTCSPHPEYLRVWDDSTAAPDTHIIGYSDDRRETVGENAPST